MPVSDWNRPVRSRTQGGVGPVADLTVSHGDPIMRLHLVARRLLFLCLIIPWSLVMCWAWLFAIGMALLSVSVGFLSGGSEVCIWDWPDNMLDACDRITRRITGLIHVRHNVKCDATALTGGVAGWLRGKGKVGIHDLLN